MFDLIEQYVAIRFRLWTNGLVWVLYEACPEEGDGVTKKVQSFNDEFKAEQFIGVHRELYKKWLQSFIEVKQQKALPKKPTMADTMAFIKKADQPKKEPY